MIKSIKTPLFKSTTKNLKVGELVNLSGIIYTARDAAHKRMIAMLENNEKLPFDVEDQVIYYVGPCPAKPGQVIGSAGPTTSSRMDAYSPSLLDLGLSGMIGKGYRSKEVINSIKKNSSVYLGAIGGVAALISKCIISEEVIAFEELGAEAIRKLEVKDLPLIVVVDSEGNNLYEIEKIKYKQ